MPPEAGTTSPEATPDAAYSVPDVSPAPPQSYPQTRDVAKRERTMHDYRLLERSLIRGRRPGSGMHWDEETQRGDEEFFQQGYDARSRILHEPDAVLDEHERLQEINAHYLDQCMEQYVDRVVQTENSRCEEKHGRGILGRMRSWFSETDLGKATHVLGKGGLALLMTSATAGTFLAPAGALMARKLGTDAAIEAAQYIAAERPILQCLRQLRLRRHDTLVQLMALRNEIANRDDDHDLATNARAAASLGANLHDNLMAIITEFDNIERDIIRQEQRLAHRKAIWKSIRAAASIAWSAEAIHELFTNGLSMGPQNLDGLADPTHAYADATHMGMDPSAAGHHIIATGSNPGIYHDLQMASDGMRFVYEQGETMANGLIAHGTGLETHLVGSTYPIAQAIGAYSGFGAAALHGWPTHIYGAVRDNHMRATMQNVSEHPLDEENKQHQAVFTLTGRDALGDASGVNHEISDLAGITRGNEAWRKGLEVKKQKFVRGAIFRVPASMVGGNYQPLPSVADPNNPDAGRYIYFQVSGWTNRGDGKNRDLQFVAFDPETQTPLHTTAEGIIDDNQSRLMEEAKADNVIDHAEWLGNNYQEFFNSRTEEAQIARLKHERGHADVENDQNWLATQAFAMPYGANGSQIRYVNQGEIIQIQSLSENKTRAVVKLFDANGHFIGDFSGARVVQLMQNTKLDVEDKEIAVTANTRMKERRGHENIEKDQTWKAIRAFNMHHRDGELAVGLNQFVEVRQISDDGTYAVVRVKDENGKWSVDYNSVPVSEILDSAIKMSDDDMPLTEVQRIQEQMGQKEIKENQKRIAVDAFTMDSRTGAQSIEQNSIILVKEISADKATATVHVHNASGAKQGEFNQVPLAQLLEHTNIHIPEEDEPVRRVDQLREELGQPEMKAGQTWRASNDFPVDFRIPGGTSSANIAANEIINVESVSKDGTRAVIRITDPSGATRATLRGVNVDAIYENANNVDLQRERREGNQQRLEQINELLRNQGLTVPLQAKLLFLYRNNGDPTAAPRFACITAVNEEGEGNIAIVMGDLTASGDLPTGKPLKTAVNSASADHLNFQEFLNRFGTRDASGRLMEELRYENRKLT